MQDKRYHPHPHSFPPQGGRKYKIKDEITVEEVLKEAIELLSRTRGKP